MGLAATVSLVPASPAAAYPFANVSLIGHGFGHGRGMGQWGALGYALNGLSGAQILSSFYGSLSAGGTTTLGALPNGWNDGTTPVKVDITGNDGTDVIVTSGSTFTVAGTSATFGAGGTYPAARLQLVALGAGNATPGIWNVFGATSATGGGCAGPWAPVAVNVSDPVVAPSMAAAFPADANLGNEVLQLCRVRRQHLRARGAFQGVTTPTNQARTVNVVGLGQYVADVTPSESPSSWGALGPPGSRVSPRGSRSSKRRRWRCAPTS